MLFLIRFTTFLAAIITLVIASKMTGNAHVKIQLPQHSKKTRIIAWCISATLCITAILEIALGNRNEFTLLKIVFYIFVWCTVTWLELDNSYWGIWDELLYKIRTAALYTTIVSFVIMFISAFYALSYEYPTWQETKQLSTTQLVSVNDGHQIEGDGSSGLFIHSFAISENGIYRYYYRAEDGGIKQDFVNAKNTTIYYIKDGESPHLDEVGVFEYWYERENNQDVLCYNNVSILYELYIPAGSIVESYQLDLQ